MGKHDEHQQNPTHGTIILPVLLASKVYPSRHNEICQQQYVKVSKSICNIRQRLFIMLLTEE